MSTEQCFQGTKRKHEVSIDYLNVIVEGHDGAGKSTLIHELSNLFDQMQRHHDRYQKNGRPIWNQIGLIVNKFPTSYPTPEDKARFPDLEDYFLQDFENVESKSYAAIHEICENYVPDEPGARLLIICLNDRSFLSTLAYQAIKENPIDSLMTARKILWTYHGLTAPNHIKRDIVKYRQWVLGSSEKLIPPPYSSIHVRNVYVRCMVGTQTAVQAILARNDDDDDVSKLRDRDALAAKIDDLKARYDRIESWGEISNYFHTKLDYCWEDGDNQYKIFNRLVRDCTFFFGSSESF